MLAPGDIVGDDEAVRSPVGLDCSVRKPGDHQRSQLTCLGGKEKEFSALPMLVRKQLHMRETKYW